MRARGLRGTAANLCKCGGGARGGAELLQRRPVGRALGRAAQLRLPLHNRPVSKYLIEPHFDRGLGVMRAGREHSQSGRPRLASSPPSWWSSPPSWPSTAEYCAQCEMLDGCVTILNSVCQRDPALSRPLSPPNYSHYAIRYQT